MRLPLLLVAVASAATPNWELEAELNAEVPAEKRDALKHAVRAEVKRSLTRYPHVIAGAADAKAFVRRLGRAERREDLVVVVDGRGLRGEAPVDAPLLEDGLEEGRAAGGEPLVVADDQKALIRRGGVDGLEELRALGPRQVHEAAVAAEDEMVGALAQALDLAQIQRRERHAPAEPRLHRRRLRTVGLVPADGEERRAHVLGQV
mmetsp:Transcript_13131/g.44916  ORF Transcript_13131/g.44916 Transcript_13131/m.44916 type:complete len:205 (-) Transcript_13131:63-677(-)